jgi:hypothetical protein
MEQLVIYRTSLVVINLSQFFGEIKMLVGPLWKKIWRLLKNLNIDLPYDPAIPQQCDTGYSKGTCTPMFIAALFTIAKLWKWPRCPINDEWIKKMWYLYTMEFYAAMKKNEMLHSLANGWNWRTSF